MKQIKECSYSPYEKVKALVALHIRITTENPYAISLQTQDWMQLKEPSLTEFKAIKRKYSEDFLEIIKEGMSNGEIKKANPEIMLNTVLSSVRWLYSWYHEDRTISPIELEIQIMEILECGVKERL